MAEIMELIEPKMYKKYVVLEKGKKVLCAELAMVLHGLLRGALLLWEKVSAQLVEWGFTINPYDWCVANKDVEYEVPDDRKNRKVTVLSAQMTWRWHVDDVYFTQESNSH